MSAAKIDYKVGDHIPSREILKSYEDEDGEIFLEVRGNPDVYFRVNKTNQVYYKIEKALMEGEELNLVEDLSLIQPESFPIPEYIPEPLPQTAPADDGHLVLEESMSTTGARSATLESSASQKKKEAEIKELEEGELVPDQLMHLCKKNDYGGYSLRLNRILYVLDGNYRVEVKAPDSNFNYDIGTGGETEVLEPPELQETVETVKPGESTTLESLENGQVQKGDTLPSHLWFQCEEDISAAGGFRIMLGDYLYLLNAQHRVTNRMRLSYSQPADITPPPTAPAPAPTPTKPAVTKQPKQLPAKEVVANVIKAFNDGLKKYGISADYFKDSVLGLSNREILIRAYNGDLTNLNDDTREAAEQGEVVTLQEKGLAFFKAVLVHELYIKSTLSGRGNNMKYFLGHVIAIEPDGTLAVVPDAASMEVQRELVEYFGERAGVYKDKSEIIKRVYRHLHFNIFDEYEECRRNNEKILFNAYVVMKLYQQTSRLDRGDGITMIRLTRDIMDYL